MKKIALLLVIVMLCLSLVACDPTILRLSDEEGVDAEISSVQLVNYEISKARKFRWWLPRFLNRPQKFDNSKCTVLETLSQDKNEEFFGYLEDHVQINHFTRKYNSPKGLCLKFTYASGEFLIVSLEPENDYIGIYASDDSASGFYGSLEHYYNECAVFANLYFEYQVPVTDRDVELYNEVRAYEEQQKEQGSEIAGEEVS